MPASALSKRHDLDPTGLHLTVRVKTVDLDKRESLVERRCSALANPIPH